MQKIDTLYVWFASHFVAFVTGDKFSRFLIVEGRIVTNDFLKSRRHSLYIIYFRKDKQYEKTQNSFVHIFFLFIYSIKQQCKLVSYLTERKQTVYEECMDRWL